MSTNFSQCGDEMRWRGWMEIYGEITREDKYRERQ